MNFWRPYPLLRLIIPFLSGIVIGICLPVFSAIPTPVYVLIPLISFFLIMLSKRYYGFRFRYFTGLLLFVFFIFTGYELSHSAITKLCRQKSSPQDGFYLLELTEQPVVKSSYMRIFCKARYKRDQEAKWIPVTGNYLLNMKMNVSQRPLFYGDILVVKTNWQEIRNTANPNCFNYSEYLSRRGIHYQAWVEDGDWIKVLRSGGWLKSWSFTLRDHLLDLLRNNKLKGNEFAVAAALLLGQVNELETGLRKAYAASGAMHILSVSGMHVGVIYLFFNFFLGFLDRRKTGRLLKTFIMLCLIWGYAFITGLSPSVVRASTMLSFIITGKALNRHPEPLNILAASLFFILILDPLIIREIGFQLSYLAVTGIYLLYKPVYDCMVTSLWFWDKVWSVLSISLVAQLATGPLSLYYFHQFPNYFLLTNLFIAPLSSLIIYTGIIALGFGAVTLVSVIMTSALGGLVSGLNFIIRFVESLPFSITSGVYLTMPELLIFYTLIILACIFLIKKKQVLVFPILICIIILQFSFLYYKLDRLEMNRITVYNLKGLSGIELSGNGRADFFYDSHVIKGFSQKLDYATALITPGWEARKIERKRLYWLGSSSVKNARDPTHVRWKKWNHFMQFESKRIAIVNEKFSPDTNAVIFLDFIIISGNPKISIRELRKFFPQGEIVIDASNHPYNVTKWLKEAAMFRISCHAVTRDGAFVREFKKDVCILEK